MWRTINGTMKNPNPNPTLKHGLAVAFTTKSNSCCAAMWRTIKGMMKNPNPNPNLPHVHNDIAWLIQHVFAPQRLRLGRFRLIKVFLKLNI